MTTHHPSPPAAGIVIGLALKYALPNRTPSQFILAANATACNATDDFQVGEGIELISEKGHVFTCEIQHRVFEDEKTGNYIRQEACSFATPKYW